MGYEEVKFTLAGDRSTHREQLLVGVDSRLTFARMLQNESIICFGGEDWWYHHQHSKNHLMRRFARAGNRVIFVNSISMGLPSISNPDLLSKIKRKLRSYAQPIRITEDGIIVVSPPVLPFYSSGWARAINRWLLVMQLRLLMVAFEMPRPILWIAIPTAGKLLGGLTNNCSFTSFPTNTMQTKWIMRLQRM
jgi:hypothetical protein